MTYLYNILIKSTTMPKIEIKDCNKVFENGVLIGHSSFGDQHKYNLRHFKTFFLIYARPEKEGGNNIEELDVWTARGREYEVAKILADARYNKGFELKSHDDYFRNKDQRM